MVNLDVIRQSLQALDFKALGIRAGISPGCKYETDVRFPVPLHLRNRTMLGYRKENVVDIRLQCREHDLRFRIAETAVEFNHLDSVRGLHQASVEDSPEWDAFLRHSGGNRPHDMLQGIFLIFGIDKRKSGIGSHSTGVRTLVTVEGALVVLGKNHRNDFLSVHETEEGELGAGEEFLHDYLAVSEPVVKKHIPERIVSLLEILGDDNALSGCEPVIFEYYRELSFPDVCQCLIIPGECLVSRCRDIVTSHESLGEILARLNDGSSF